MSDDLTGLYLYILEIFWLNITSPQLIESRNTKELPLSPAPMRSSYRSFRFTAGLGPFSVTRQTGCPRNSARFTVVVGLTSTRCKFPGGSPNKKNRHLLIYFFNFFCKIN